MKLFRHYISGEATLCFLAILSGMGIISSYGTGEGRHDITAAFQKGLWLSGTTILFSLHLLLKGVYSIIRRDGRRYGAAVVYISLGIMLSGLLFSIHFRQTQVLRAEESDMPARLLIRSLRLDMPSSVLAVGETVDMERVSASAIIEDEGRRMEVSAWPFVNTSGGLAHINDAGMTPILYISIAGKRTLLPKIQVLPPNRKESFGLGNGYHVDVSLAHERAFRKGRLLARSYNLRDPSYHIVLKKGGRVILDRVLKEKEQAGIGDVSISVAGTKKWVELAVVKDRAVFIIYAALIGLALGPVLHIADIFIFQSGQSRNKPI